MTPRHLTRLFTERLGQPPGRYVRQARTEAAAQLLQATTLPVARVATRCASGTCARPSSADSVSRRSATARHKPASSLYDQRTSAAPAPRLVPDSRCSCVGRQRARSPGITHVGPWAPDGATPCAS
ncbi:helix-turn-helix domain-containing protein [Streptomyces sp. NPDC059949]|uniref:helix-turn-helix domain-containing protein n=1 Tax=Streptomyces sp. NPDC059949 TaxID=3347013 RepID=UPI003657F4F5